MKIKTIMALIITTYLLSSCAGNSATQNNEENYEIAEQHYTHSTVLDDGRELELDISYPVVTDLGDTKKQDEINKLLKDKAFQWFDDWSDYEEALKNVSLSIEYDILFQSEDYLCVNYSGMYFEVAMPHPNHLFETINIDINAGKRLRLPDMVNVDDAFVQTVKEYFGLYIDFQIQNVARFSNELQKSPEYALIYEQRLNDYDDDAFLNMLLKADADSSIKTYFTNEVFGLRFDVQFAAGGHYEIEIKREDMEKHMIISDLWE